MGRLSEIFRMAWLRQEHVPEFVGQRRGARRRT